MADSQGFVSVTSTADVPLTSNPVPTGSGERGVAGQVVQLFNRSSHPTAAMFHVLFKTSALLFYLFSGIFTDSFVIVFVVCVVLMAFDFWTVKVRTPFEFN